MLGFLFVVLITPIFCTHAASLGSFGNPLQVQISPSPTQVLDQSIRDMKARLDQRSLENSITAESILRSQQQRTLESQLQLQQTLQNKVICSTSGATLRNGICVPNQQICSDDILNSIWSGSYTSQGRVKCVCKTGYVPNGNTCVVDVSKIQNTDTVSNFNQTTNICNGKSWGNCPVGQNYYCPPTGDAQCTTNQIIETISGGGGGNSGTRISNKDEIIPDIKVLESDVEKVDKKGTLIKPTALRKCPSTTCEIIRYYAETSELNILEEYKSGEWYKIETENNTGWVAGSSFDKNSIIYTKLPKLPNFNLATSSPAKTEQAPPENFWQKLKNYFGFLNNKK